MMAVAAAEVAVEASASAPTASAVFSPLKNLWFAFLSLPYMLMARSTLLGTAERIAALETGPHDRSPAEPDPGFVVIHDEPHLSLVYDEGEYKGHIVDANLDKLAAARRIAADYGLSIVHVRSDNYSNFDLRLTKEGCA